MFTSLIGNGALWVANLVRSMRRDGLETIVLRPEGAIPELPPLRPSLPFPLNKFAPRTTQASLAEMRKIVQCIELDDRVGSVVLLLDSLRAEMVSLHSLRRHVSQIRSTGKWVVGWLTSGGVPEYYLASACDEVIMPVSGRLTATGLRAEVVFLRDALGQVGIEADLESIAEYKVAPDTFRRKSMSEPHRHMLEGLLGSYYDHVIAAIADGRGLSVGRVQALIDLMPMAAEQAAEVGLVDALLYEDEMPGHLSRVSDGPESNRKPEPAPLVPWRQAHRWLRRPMRPVSHISVGVVSLDGLIVTGRGWRPPVPLPLPFVQAQAGSETVIAALRQAESSRHVAVVILYVNTPGGSALASDLIWREVSRLRLRKPVVVLMGAQATSGGYYVAAGGSRIVARPMTMTGSIGVWGGKFVLASLLDKMRIGTGSVQCGQMADLYSGLARFDASQRERIRLDLEATYSRFLDVVASGRSMDRGQVEAVARGRVWTGAQALEVGLVDQLGDFETALATAKDLIGVPAERLLPIVRLDGGRAEGAPLPFPAEKLPHERVFEAFRALAEEHIWALSPWTLRIGG